MSAPDPVAAYRCPAVDDLIYDDLTAIMAEELSALLSGWLGLTPELYPPVDIQTVAAVMVDRLGLREDALRLRQRVMCRILGLR